MVCVRDTGGVFEASLDEVWAFVGSGDPHAASHGHRAVTRQRHSPNSGTYSWVQSFGGKDQRFTMRWTSFPPVGLAYEVLEGPFAGSTFFLVYEPLGRRTGVSVLGEFVSPTLDPQDIGPAVRRFFETEYLQDGEALRAWARDRPPSD